MKELSESRKTTDPAKLEGVVPTVLVSGAGAGAPGGSGEKDKDKGKKSDNDEDEDADETEGGGKGKKGKSGASGGNAANGNVPAHQDCGDPVDAQRGNVVGQHDDLALPGLIPVKLVRAYNSSEDPRGLPFGRAGWVHSYHRCVELSPDEGGAYRMRTAEGGWAPLNGLERGQVHFFRGGQLEVIRRADRVEVYSLRTRQTEVFERLVEGEEVYWLREIQSPHGHRVQLSYQGTQLQAIYDTCGRAIQFTWDEHKRITRASIIAGGGEQRAVAYLYNEAGELSEVYDQLGFCDCFEYDGKHRMVKITWKNGVSFYYEYHTESGKCIRTWGDGGIHAYEFSRSDEGREVVVTGTNEPLTYTFDENGETVGEKSLDGSVDIQREYDGDQLLLWESNAAGEVTRYEYDERGFCTAKIDPTGNTTRWEYKNDLLVKRIAPDGQETVYRYDGYRENYFQKAPPQWQQGGNSFDDGPQFSYLGTHLNLSAIQFPTGDWVALDYDQQGRLLALRGPDGVLEAYAYNEAHDVVRISDGRGAVWQFEHDVLGQPVRRTDPVGAVTSVQYDALGQVIRVELPDGSSSTSSYDALGNVSTFTDPLGRQTQLRYGGTGVLVEQILPNGAAWKFEYDSDERLRTIRNPKTETYEFRYNRAGVIEEEKTFDGRSLGYTYDGALRLARITKPGDEYREFLYDGAGRIVAEHSNHGAQLYERDGVGRLISASVEDGPETFVVRLERDQFGRVVKEHQGEQVLSYEYDAQNRRVAREVLGQRTEYGYDAMGALASVTHDGHKVEIRRDVLGREVRRLANGGKLAVDSAYDLMGRLISQAAIGPAPQGRASEEGVPPEAKEAQISAEGEVVQPRPVGLDGWRILSQREYRYDQSGRPTSIHDRSWGTTLYKYDNLDQLRRAQRGRFNEVFDYDPTSSLTRALRSLDEQRVTGAEPDEAAAEGKKLQKDEIDETHWHVEPGNLLVRDARFTYELDENHRRKVRIDRESGERTDYTWDCRDRLRQVKRPDGTRVRFFYDAFGRRVRKDVHPPLPDEEALRKLAEEELEPALEAEDERRRAELAELEEIPNQGTADDALPANSNRSEDVDSLQVRPPARHGSDQAEPPELAAAAPEPEELILAHRLKTYEVGFLWDGDELAAEVHSKEGERVHVHRPGTFVPLLQVEQGETFHVITDHLGTPKELIDNETRVAWSAAHGAWNNIQEQWFDDAHPRGRRVSSPFRGLGQYYDAETQLSCTRFRYWEADTGRWLSADPLGIVGGLNLLALNGAPTVDVDPLGLACATRQNSAGQWIDDRGRFAPKPNVATLPSFKGKSVGAVERILQNRGYVRTNPANPKNQRWVHPDGSEVQIHAYGGNATTPYKAGNNAHAHKSLGRHGQAGTVELADDGATQVHPHTQAAHIGLKNPADYPTVAGRPHGS